VFFFFCLTDKRCTDALVSFITLSRGYYRSILCPSPLKTVKPPGDMACDATLAENQTEHWDRSYFSSRKINTSRILSFLYPTSDLGLSPRTSPFQNNLLNSEYFTHFVYNLDRIETERLYQYIQVLNGIKHTNPLFQHSKKDSEWFNLKAFSTMHYVKRYTSKWLGIQHNKTPGSKTNND
jgi:hypothetical protein